MLFRLRLMGLLSESPMYERTSRRKLKRGAGVGAGFRIPFGSLWAGMRLRLCLYGPDTGIGTFSSGAPADSGCAETAAAAETSTGPSPPAAADDDELLSVVDAAAVVPASDAGTDVAGPPALPPSAAVAVAGFRELADGCDFSSSPS